MFYEKVRKKKDNKINIFDWAITKRAKRKIIENFNF